MKIKQLSLTILKDICDLYNHIPNGINIGIYCDNSVCWDIVDLFDDNTDSVIEGVQWHTSINRRDFKSTIEVFNIKYISNAKGMRHDIILAQDSFIKEIECLEYIVDNRHIYSGLYTFAAADIEKFSKGMRYIRLREYVKKLKENE